MAACRQAFEAQRKDVLRKLRAEKAWTRKDVNDLYDQLEYDAALAGLLVPLYRALVAEAGADAMALVSDGTFDETTVLIERYFKSHPLRVAQVVNAETAKQLRATLAEGVNAGESFAELSTRVENVFGALAGYRAERIARTETISASTYAAIEAWDQSGVVNGKEWFTAEDERVCPFCSAMDGQVLDLRRSYFAKGDEITVEAEGGKASTMKVGFDDVQGPPLHVSCRCVLVPIATSR